MSQKKKGPIVVDDSDEVVEELIPAISSTSNEIPVGFFTFGYIAMKYLVVKAYKGKYKSSKLIIYI